jgi:hypothetical protein
MHSALDFSLLAALRNTKYPSVLNFYCRLYILFYFFLLSLNYLIELQTYALKITAAGSKNGAS